MGENTVNGDAKTETTNDTTEIKSKVEEAVSEEKDAEVKESTDAKNEEEAIDETVTKEAVDETGDGDKQNADDDEQDDEDDELGEDSKGYKMSFKSSLYIKIMGFKRLPSMADELKLYYKFFVETLGVSPPLVQIPGPDDVSVFFQLKSVEDRQKVFSQMKGKVYMWKEYKLGIKRVVLKSLSDKKEFGKLPLDEAIKILYPYKDIPYSQQLKQKSAIAKNAADLVLPKESLSKSLKTKKNMRSFRIREIVPMIPVEGYDYYASFSIEEDPDTKEILVGLRAMSEDRERTAIVPLDLCLSIPRQMAIVVKSFVESLPEIGFHPYNPKTREGDILGITLKMTLSGRFILTVIIPKLETLHFKQLTEDGVEREEGEEGLTMEGEVNQETPTDAEDAKKTEKESTDPKPEEKKSAEEDKTSDGETKAKEEGEETKSGEDNASNEVTTENNANSQVFRIEETYSYMTKKKMEEAKEKIEKYFDKNGKELSIDSVYLSMVYAGYLSSMLTGKDDTSPAANHILGLAYVPDNYNGLILRVTWERDSYVKSLRSILGLIEAQGKINASSRVYLISPYRLVGLYLAKKCAHVTMVYYWSRDNMNELQSWAKSVGVNNIEFINAKLQPKRMFPPDNAVTIVWQSTKPSLVHRFLVSGITNFIFVSYWIKDPTHSYVKQHEKQFETVLNKLRISYLYPVDIAPYTERYGMVVFFNGRSGTAPAGSGIANRLGYPSRPPALIGGGGKSGPKGGKPPSLMNKRIPPRALTDRMDRGRSGGSWGPDPWAGGSQDMQPGVDSTLAQLDQVASGVMQNLQAVSQQMQAVLPSLMQSQMVSPPNHSGGSWGNKRRYDDYDNDNYDRQWGGPSKRRKDGPGNREEITGGGKRGDGSLTNQAWGEHNTSMSDYERRRYLAQPPEWTDSIRQVITYNRPSNNSSNWRPRRSNY